MNENNIKYLAQYISHVLSDHLLETGKLATIGEYKIKVTISETKISVKIIPPPKTKPEPSMTKRERAHVQRLKKIFNGNLTALHVAVLIDEAKSEMKKIKYLAPQKATILRAMLMEMYQNAHVLIEYKKETK